MYIIDTHALLWYLYNSSEISEKARQIIDNEEQIFTSIASLWEIAIKQSIGKLDLEYSITQIENLCKQKQSVPLGDLRVSFGWQKIQTKPQIASRHLDELISLPNHHNDPFDRLIICQAKTENFTIITRDAIIPKYPVKTVW